MTKTTRFHFIFISAFLLFSCRPSYRKYISAYRFTNSSNIPDYSRLEYWAAHPDKKDPSDSIPAPLLSTTVYDSDVDVFFLHPTTFGSLKDTAWNAGINDPEVNAKTDYSTILYQASAFNNCRVFAPRYRQANIRAYFSRDSDDDHRAFDTAYEDIRNAFLYYLGHYNHGHPIIIASHSQGSTHAERLLKEFFDGKPLQSKLIAAYVIGMDIPENYFTSIPPCADSLQTGCFIGWRTFRRGYEPEFIRHEAGNAYVTNPLTWTTGNEYAPRTLNRGAVLYRFNKVALHAADAQIHDVVLWIHKPRFPGSIFYLSGNYHIGDINLFYVNIRDNVRERISAYRKR